MKTFQLYRYALDLTPAQRRNVLAHAGAARAAHNWALARVKAAMDQRVVGRPVGFPWFKSRRRTTPSVRFTTGTIRVEPDRMHVTLPRLGRLKLHESARKLARRLEAGTARIMSATVRGEGGRWHVAFTVEVERAERRPARSGSTVGVDVGITHLAVLSTGEVVPNPRHLGDAQRRLRDLGRALSGKQGPDRRTRRRPSKRWHRAVVVENLNVSGMLRNRHLARHIADAGFAEIRRQLAYKTGWNGGRLLIADRWYPSSKTCSACGAVKTKLSLAEREYRCDTCGPVLDRDRLTARRDY